MKIERKWAMPSRWTFEIGPIRKLIDEEMTGISVDPFAGQSDLATHRNDINGEQPSNMDALSYLRTLPDGLADTVLYDPPYSMTQADVRYGVGFGGKKYWADVKDEIARVTKSTGKVISFGWNSMGMNKKRGFEINRILLVAHGGSRNDTIVTVETKHGAES